MEEAGLGVKNLATLECIEGTGMCTRGEGCALSGLLTIMGWGPAIGMTEPTTRRSVLSFPGTPLAHRTTMTLPYGALPTGGGHTAWLAVKCRPIVALWPILGSPKRIEKMAKYSHN